MMTKRYQGMDLFIRDQVIFAFRIRTKIVLGREIVFLRPPLPFIRPHGMGIGLEMIVSMVFDFWHSGQSIGLFGFMTRGFVV